MKREFRFTHNLELRQVKGKPMIRGYAAKFNVPSQPLPFLERIKPGAFTDAILHDDVRALVGHDPDKIIGRTKSGTLTLREDDQGLYCEIQPPETTVGRDVVESIKRGDLDGMSFGFSAVEDDWQPNDKGEMEREVRKAKLFDVSVVTYPAYPQTEVAVRELRSLMFPDGEPTVPAVRKKPLPPMNHKHPNRRPPMTDLALKKERLEIMEQDQFLSYTKDAKKELSEKLNSATKDPYATVD